MRPALWQPVEPLKGLGHHGAQPGLLAWDVVVQRHRIHAKRGRQLAHADVAAAAPRSSGIAKAADVLTVSSLQAKLAAQVAGLGVGFLPECPAAWPIAQGRLVALRVAAPKSRVQLSVAWRSSEGGLVLSWFVERLKSIDLTAPGSLK